MKYLYERKKELEKELERWMPYAFERGARDCINAARARLDEINRAIRELEHE